MNENVKYIVNINIEILEYHFDPRTEMDSARSVSKIDEFIDIYCRYKANF